MRFISFIVAYDGAHFCGSQRQKNGPSVQGELERVLESVLKHPAPIVLAGRTDAGVHATGQVGRFATTNPIPVERVPLAMNAKLDRAVRVLSAREVDERWHPRFSARSRVYRYRIDNAATMNPMLRDIAGHVGKTLNVEAMREAVRVFEGEQDFVAWQNAGSPNGPTTRRVLRVEVSESQAFGSALVEVEIEANAFLYGMARNIVGALVRAGWGELDGDGIQRLTLGRDRTKCPAPAPPQGLCLTEVKY